MDEDLCLQYETIRFVFARLAFFLCKCTGRQWSLMHRKTMSLTLETVTKSTAKAIAAQQKSLEFLAKVV